MQPKQNQRRFDVLVIGSGIAGLTCAALLARDGCRVALLEAHDKPGGCAGYFEAGEFQFPVGATLVLGLEPGGLHRQVFDLLGVEPPASELLKGIRMFLPDRDIFLSHDPRHWRRERRRLGGHVRGQELFWRLQEIVAAAGWQTLNRRPSLPLQSWMDIKRNLGLISPDFPLLFPSMTFTAGEIMQLLGIAKDRTFRAVVELQLIITAQASADNTLFANAAPGLDLWRHGAFQLFGGTGALSRKLLEAFHQYGGTSFFCAHANCIRRKSEGGFEVETERGSFFADKVVANMPRENMPGLLDGAPKSQARLTRQTKRGGQQWGAVNLYCGIREEALPAGMPLNTHVLSSYDWRMGEGEDVFLNFSLPGDRTQAPEGYRALNVSTHTHLAEWEELNRREYRIKKREWRERLLTHVRRAVPDFDAGKKFVITGTPSTWERYALRRGVGGYPFSRFNTNLFALPNRVEEDLWLCGDTTFPGQGTVACTLSGMNVWREITGRC